ncbi:VOC family protein [Aliiglaciecola litoralis]|uniref:VOC family protein n=1 Tax=Aliiglaciecola litoralis TaxID=582857 RepID=A0ABN1LRT5_9ALTE
MIRLEHLNLVVKSLPSSMKFYQAAMPHWRVRQQGINDWYGVERNWLHFGDDYNYLTLNEAGEGKVRDRTSNQLGLAHFAFEVKNLDALIKRMKTAGFEPHHYGAQNEFRTNIYFFDPNGLEIEFVEYLSDLPEQRNSSDVD